MRRSVLCAILLAVMAAGSGPPAPAAADGPATLAAETCQAPFVLVVPAALVRERGALSVVVHDDEAGARLLFELAPDGVSVSLQRDGAAVELGRAQAPPPDGEGEIVLKRRPGGLSLIHISEPTRPY